MKAVILDGSTPGDVAEARILTTLLETLTAGGWQVEQFPLARMNLGHCRGCFGCWVQKPGLCVLNDDGQQLAAGVISSDLTVIFTPVVFGGYSSELKNGMDRLLGLISPFFTQISGEVHHQRRYERYPGFWAVGVQRTQDQSAGAIFSSLVERNAINFHAPVYAATQVTTDPDNLGYKKELKNTLARLGENL